MTKTYGNIKSEILTQLGGEPLSVLNIEYDNSKCIILFKEEPSQSIKANVKNHLMSVFGFYKVECIYMIYG